MNSERREQQPGDQVGPFTLEAAIGQGGFGMVFRARDAEGQVYALKFLHAHLTADWFAVSRLLHEMRLLRKFRHKHIVRLLGAGRPGGRLYLIEEYCALGSLRRALERFGRLPLHRTLDVILPVAEALAYLHGHAVAHGDIKPDNILCNADGTVKVSDFGVASSLVTSHAVSAAGVGELAPEMLLDPREAFAGTRHYLAPEFTDSMASGPSIAGDIFALGMTFYELLTGSRPVRSQIARGLLPIIPPYVVAPIFQSDLEQLVARCLAMSPQDRYSTAADIALAMRQLQTQTMHAGDNDRGGTKAAWSL